MNPWSSAINSLTNESDGAAGVVLLKIRLLGTLADWAALVEVTIICVASNLEKATQSPLPFGLFLFRSKLHRDREYLMKRLDYQPQHDWRAGNVAVGFVADLYHG